MMKAEEWFNKDREISNQRPSLYLGEEQIAYVSDWELEPAIFFKFDRWKGRGMDLHTARLLRDFLVEVL